MPAQPGGLNILPKKKWHVRTKENVAKVKRDEAKAADEERQRLERAALAEQEARTALLRKRAAERLGTTDEGPSTSEPTEQLEHVNFFRDLEEQERTFGANKGHQEDKRTDQEKWEKAIGLLKYLGEGSKEHSGDVPWYEKPPARVPTAPRPAPSVAHTAMLLAKLGEERARRERHSPSPDSHRKRTESKKRKKEKKLKKKSKRKHRSSSEDSPSRRKRSKRSDSSNYNQVANLNCNQVADPAIEKLRAERIRRELEEKQKSETLIRRMSGVPDPPKAEEPKFEQRYNSQFNPELCRQNRRN